MKFLWARGYYRLPLAELEGLRARISEAEADWSETCRKVSAGGTVLERQLVAEKAVAVDAKHADTEAKKAALAAAKAEEREARQKELDASIAAEGAARLALAAAQRAAAEAGDAICEGDPRVREAAEVKTRAVAGLMRKREELLRKGRVVIRYRCESPAWTQCPGDGLVHTMAFVRVTGLSADELDSDDGSDEYYRLPTETVIETGPYEGVLELNDVDLSFAVPVELRGVDDLNRLQPLRVVLRGILRSGSCQGPVALGPDGRLFTAGVERTCVRDVYLYPQVPNWEDTPDSAVGR